MALSDLVVRQAKATGKAYTLPDIDGLSLAVTATGSKSWHFRYYWMKEPKRMSLGTYPEVSLREARALRDEARALVAKDINPRLHRKQKHAAVKLAGENTFEAIYKKWLAHRERGLKKGRQTTLSILPRVFAKDVLHGEAPTYGYLLAASGAGASRTRGSMAWRPTPVRARSMCRPQASWSHPRACQCCLTAEPRLTCPPAPK